MEMGTQAARQVSRLTYFAKRQLRDLQTHVPALRAAKFGFYNSGTRLAGLFVEAEFKLLEKLAPMGLVLDVGGNWGQSINALRRYARPGKIISFEPNAGLAAQLSKRFAAASGIAIEGIALGAQEGEFELHVPRYRNFTYDGLASIDRHSAVQWLNAASMARFDPAKLSISSQMVQVRKLDSLGLEPDLIKMDVQGLELAVAQGGIATLRRCQPMMIVEDALPELVTLAATAGLRPYRLKDGRLLADDLGGSNTLFLAEKHARVLLGNKT